MNDEQGSGPKSQIPGFESQGSTSQSSNTNADRDTASFDTGVNAAEIAGESVSVVGEATGRFPRSSSVERSERESTGRHAFMVGAGILISRIIGVMLCHTGWLRYSVLNLPTTATASPTSKLLIAVPS